MRDRMREELALLQSHYGADVIYHEAGDWFLIPRYPLPAICNQSIGRVCFCLRAGYPGIEPYGFFIASEITCNNTAIAGGGSPPAPPPFTGNWRFISWSPEGWVGTADIVSGPNLWAWARTFAARLREGP